MIVAMRRRYCVPGLSAIIGTEELNVCCINFVCIFGIGEDPAVIPGPLAEFAIIVYFRPRLAPVVRPKHTALFRFEQGVNPLRVCGRNTKPDIAEHTLWQPGIVCEVGPGIA